MAHAVFRAKDLLPYASRAKKAAGKFSYGDPLVEYLAGLHALLDLAVDLGNGEVTLDHTDAGLLAKHGAAPNPGFIPAPLLPD